MTLRAILLGTVIAATLQTGVLAKIIYDRASALQAGQEVLLETGFIDPRDLFRGHYTALNLLISRIPSKDVEIVGDFKWNDPIYVELDTAANFAKPVRLTETYPENPKGPVLLGATEFSSQSENEIFQINFNFDRFYADKDRAITLQNHERERKLGVILSVAPDGTAMIKGLTIDGKKIYEEPLF
jgi:uncharacterized membrane-anchored protein